MLSSRYAPEEELVAICLAANDTIGMDKVLRNETTIAQNILTSLQIMSTPTDVPEATHLPVGKAISR